MPAPALVLGAVSIASSLAKGALGFGANKKDAERLREIGKKNYAELMRQAELEGDVGSQQVVNLLEQQARQKALVGSMYSKSGLSMTGTPARSMAEMQEDFDYNVDQAQESVQERVARIQHQAEMALMSAESQAAGADQAGRNALIGAGFGAAKGFLQAYGGLGDKVPGSTPEPMALDYGLFNPQMNTINEMNTSGMLTGFQYDPGYNTSPYAPFR